MSVDLSTFSNATYQTGASVLKRITWFVLGSCFINSYLPIPQFVKVKILSAFGAKIGAGLVIKPKVNIKYPWLLSIGSHCWIGEQVWIDNLVQVNMANHVCLSQGAMLLTGNHDYKKSTFDLITGEINLEEGVWIGAKAVVCPGVRCKSHSVLAVSSVANSDLEAYSIYVGNPAIRKRERQISL